MRRRAQRVRPRDGFLLAAGRSTLIWRTEHALYRMETDLPLDEARAIAETLP